jgi:prepilin-type N-terminal cleavage/methylation domain-containing protein
VSASIKKRWVRQKGMTVAELVVAIAIIGLLIVPATFVILYFYGGTIQNNLQARLAVESGTVLRSIVDELRVASGIRSSNTISDPNAPAGGWTTSNSSLVLIISTPVIDTSNNYVIDSSTGEPYQNELVYFATGGVLYKRYLANSGAAGNRFKTSCPAALATAGCPADVVLSKHFKAMSFQFYDQDDASTTVYADARSIQMTLQMEDSTFGRTMSFSNNIRITMRNAL